jgi:plasmid maintenance system antidote protein VapI
LDGRLFTPARGTSGEPNSEESTIASVIAGRRQLSKANVLGLSKFFGVSPTLFME